MKYGFSLVVRGADAGPETFKTMAERAEALGIDSLWLSAHVIVPRQVKSHYSMVKGRTYPETWRECYWEPFTVLAYLSAITRRITLGTSVVVLPMHNPFELAKQVAEVDCLSGGRFVFGIGVGWFEEEFEILGQSYGNRGKRTDEALALMKTLWADDPVRFEGKYYNVDEAWFSPKPVSRPHPPIWVAGASTPALRRAARFGDYFHPVRAPLAYLEEAKVELARHVADAGRAPGSVGLAVKMPLTFQDGPPGSGQFPTQGRPADVVAAIRAYRDAGVDHLVFDLVPETLATALETMERFAEEVRPRV
ncbi:MAG: LLM class F420-dependent oxidoreductase [Ectothiorhodospiraceae bacterium]|nr:LLM class F420-dependent oxidoreductase [Chromatiales bacterium]MCP5154368.1 LLM class F420-dependent oxidoreductase [Ectothiorhodospiraceae bacterium]